MSFLPVLQQTTAHSSASTSLTFTFLPAAAGDLTVIACGDATPAGTTNPISEIQGTDNKGNSYSMIVQTDVTANGSSVAILACQNAVGGATSMTVTFSGVGTNLAGSFAEFGFPNLSVDRTSIAQGSGTAANSGNTLATRFATELIVGAAVVYALSGTPAATSPSPNGGGINSVGVTYGCFMSFGDLSTTGVQHAQYTLTNLTNQDWVCAVATFNQPAVSGTKASFFLPQESNSFLPF